MIDQVRIISLGSLLGGVNCYLFRMQEGFILVDTGWAGKRSTLDAVLGDAGCGAGELKLIILTHGDFDHCANCRHLRDRFGAAVAMHRDDAGMVENGDMFWNRKRPNVILRSLARLMFRLPRVDRFTPAVFLEDGQDLGEYGLDARIFHIPGHSKGSIGVLTANGDFICGDLFENRRRPSFNSIMDDPPMARQNLERLRAERMRTVYPGHGSPFPGEMLRGLPT
jgi:glyoxylase-like metal-dependent hydrolase (beta-lactamase superfamily II)